MCRKGFFQRIFGESRKSKAWMRGFRSYHEIAQYGGFEGSGTLGYALEVMKEADPYPANSEKSKDFRAGFSSHWSK